jgi:hypothetical protein
VYRSKKLKSDQGPKKGRRAIQERRREILEEYIIKQRTVSVTVTLLTHFQEVFCSNLGSGTGYSDVLDGFIQSFQEISGVVPQVALKQDMQHRTMKV